VLEAAAAAGLTQTVDFATHIRGNTLDLVLTNMPDRLENVQEAGRLGKSDHVIITCDVRTKRSGGEKIKVKNWSRADWAGIKKGLRETAWPTTEDDKTAEDSWQLL
jgi:hypothetical protein